jgi:hypothetical protein
MCVPLSVCVCLCLPCALFRTDRAVLASSGFYGDIVQLNKRLKIRIEVPRRARTRERVCVCVRENALWSVVFVSLCAHVRVCVCACVCVCGER